MDKLTIQLKPSLQEQMSQYDIDWSQVCYEAIQTKLKHLNNQNYEDRINQLIDIDLEPESYELGNFDIPEFPREVYQAVKKAWETFNFCDSMLWKKKPPTSQQVKQLWNSWYSPIFDEYEWLYNWEEYRMQEVEALVRKAYGGNYTNVNEQNEFLLHFNSEYHYSLEPRYIAFVEFLSKFIFNSEIIDVKDLNPLNFKSVKIEQRDELPEAAGIYFVIDESEIYYIGISENIQERWYSHNKLPYLDPFPNLRISYLDSVPQHYLKNLESTLIKHFKPRLNIKENPLYQKRKP